MNTRKPIPLRRWLVTRLLWLAWWAALGLAFGAGSVPALIALLAVVVAVIVWRSREHPSW